MFILAIVLAFVGGALTMLVIAAWFTELVDDERIRGRGYTLSELRRADHATAKGADHRVSPLWREDR